MKKIMFNDKYNLTELTLSGKKTRTTRIPASFQFLDDAVKTGWSNFVIVKNKLMCYNSNGNACIQYNLPYQVGEVIAVAQSYNDAGIQFIPNEPRSGKRWGNPKVMPGWSNKMFVRAKLMPQRIRITDLKVERLQDISDEDCAKEGVIRFSKNEYYIKGVLEKRNSFNSIAMQMTCTVDLKVFRSGKNAFKYLINAVSGKGTWESNAYVLAIYYELVK